VALPRHDECCGFGGTFAVKNAEVSTAMGLEKIRSIEETGATVCAAGDNSCLMQIGGLLHRQGTAVRCMHLAEILAATDAGDGLPALRQAQGRPEHSRGTAEAGSDTYPAGVAAALRRKPGPGAR